MFIEGDIHLDLLKLFDQVTHQRTMIEVGAAGPDVLSIGHPFREQGWRVISVEPNPRFAAAHRERGHEIVEAACSSFTADAHDFFLCHANSTYWGHQLSDESYSSLGTPETFIDKSQPFVEKITVTVTTLDDIVRRRNVTQIDLLVIDVEGSELEVMKGLTLIQPSVVVLENLHNTSAYPDYMKSRGYHLLGQNLHNEIYGRIEARAS